MNPNLILKYHWRAFLGHVCEFYPFEKPFIDKYADELDWRKLSRNQSISWDFDFIVKYSNRFLWRDLACNAGINWTIDSMQRFKIIFDETKSWVSLGQNPNLIVSEELLDRFKKICVNEDNRTWTLELKAKYGNNVWPRFEQDKVKTIDLSDLDKVLKKMGKCSNNNPLLYSHVFLPIVQQTSIEEIFAGKINLNQKYYFMRPLRDDKEGLVPEFTVKGDNPFMDFSLRGLFKLEKELRLVNSREQEGPDRLYDVAQFAMSFNTILLISENVKKVLDQFKLPAHFYHEVDLQAKQVKTTTKYYLLHLDFDTLTQDLDYTSQDFYYLLWDDFSSNYGEVEVPIRDFDAYHSARMELQEKVGGKTIVYPSEYKLRTNFDIYSYSVYGHFVVTEFVKGVLEKAFPGQIRFESAQLLNIRIDQSKYEEKRDVQIDLSGVKNVQWVRRKDDQFFFDKAERLKKDEPRLDLEQTGKDEFAQRELALNVLFPKALKSKIKKNKLKIEGYTILPLSEYYINNEFSEQYPETYQATIIAQNDYGDSVGLILEKRSDFMLQTKLYEFLHETGDVRPFRAKGKS